MLDNHYNDHPLVSICCITYNHEKFITKTINGFLNQETNFNYEILIGEDCSTDNTRNIIEEIASRHPQKIRLFANAQNMGARKNFQNIRKNAKGKYIAVCEGDDYWTDTLKLKKQIAVMEKNPDISFCFHSAKMVTAGGIATGIKLRPYASSGKHGIEDIIRIAGGGIPSQSKIYRRELMLDPPDWHKNAHVGDMATDLYLSSFGYGYYLDETMSVYRLGARGSWTRKLYSGPNLIEKKINMLKKDIELYDNFNEFTGYKNNETIEKIKREILYSIEYLSNPFYKKTNTLIKLSENLSEIKKKKMLIKFSIVKAYAFCQKLLSPFIKED